MFNQRLRPTFQVPRSTSCVPLRPTLSGRALVGVLTIGLLIANQAQAATYYWDGGTTDIAGNGNGASGGGNGTWNTAIKNWDAGAVAHIAWSNLMTDAASFGGTAGTVTIGTVNANVVGLNTGYTLQTGTITFGGTNPKIDACNNAESWATISANLAGTMGLTICVHYGNNSVLNLKGNNIGLSGGIGITASTGDVRMGNNNALGSGNNVTMSAYSSGYIAYLTLNDYDLSIGTLTGDQYSEIRALSGTSQLTINETSGTTFAGTVTDGGGILSVVKNGNQTLALSGVISYTGSTTVNAGQLRFSVVPSVSPGTPLVNASGALYLCVANTDWSSRISGVTGPGTLIIGWPTNFRGTRK